MAGLLLKYYRLDSLEFNLIIHEQAINITSIYTPSNIRDVLYLSDFIEEIKQTTPLSGSNNNIEDSETFFEVYKEKILNRTQSPSIL